MTNIACLGWGSLIWDPRTLPIRRGWFDDGPLVSVEFARHSRDGRITLVIVPDVRPVRVLWTLMDVEAQKDACKQLRDACERLQEREGIGTNNVEKHVGRWSHGMPDAIPGIEEWARSKGLGGVIWTALPAKFDGEERMPKENEVITHLRRLKGARRDEAERYIRRAPRQIDTVYRRRIEAEFGWLPTTEKKG